MKLNERRSVYIPDDIWQRLRAIAERERRSFSAQIVHFLVQAIEAYERQHPTP